MKKPIREIRIDGNLAYVPLTQGYEAVIDAEDVPLVDVWNWYAIVDKRSDGSIRTIYAGRGCGPRASHTTIFMHREILRTPDGFDSDHRDGDGLNNTKANLRIALRAENTRNRRLSISNTSGVKGVYWNKSRKKWQATITLDGKAFFLGRFSDAGDAALAYMLASVDMHGEFSTPAGLAALEAHETTANRKD